LKAEHESADHYEHWLWTKASLDTTCSELDALRLVAGQYDEMVAQLQVKLAESESQAEKWKNSVGRMTDLLYEAERKVKEMEEKVVQVRQQAQDEEKKEDMRKQVREQQLQIEAYEGEINYFHVEIERQSQQLADMQANLVEREISLGQTREVAQKQAAQLEQIKKLAGSRIRQLEKELAETQQKLKDLSVWLERRRRRGESLEPPKA
jgi:chromosome segregation ATPase